MDIALYEGGKAAVAGVSNVVKLSSNENPFGPSDRAKDAFARSVHQLHRYPSTDHASLREAIADVHGIDPSRILCGVSSDEIITFLCQAYAGPKDEVVYTEHGFLMYRISALVAIGATPVEVAERDRTTDVRAILKACNRRTKLVFALSNNPTGTMISQAEIERLADGLPPQAILVLDGAYAEYVEGFDGGIAVVEKCARECGDDADLLEDLRAGRPADRLGIWAEGDHRRAEPHPRAVQSVEHASEAAEAAVRDQDYVNKCPRRQRPGCGSGWPKRWPRWGALGHVDGEFHPGALCQPGRGRGLRPVPAAAGPDRAAGCQLQAAAARLRITVGDEGLDAAGSPMPSGSSRGRNDRPPLAGSRSSGWG